MHKLLLLVNLLNLFSIGDRKRPDIRRLLLDSTRGYARNTHVLMVLEIIHFIAYHLHSISVLEDEPWWYLVLLLHFLLALCWNGAPVDAFKLLLVHLVLVLILNKVRTSHHGFTFPRVLILQPLSAAGRQLPIDITKQLSWHLCVSAVRIIIIKLLLLSLLLRRLCLSLELMLFLVDEFIFQLRFLSSAITLQLKVFVIRLVYWKLIRIHGWPLMIYTLTNFIIIAIVNSVFGILVLIIYL